MVSTHDKRMLPAIPCSELMSRLEDASKFEVIGVDEGQFFPDLVQFCEKLAARGRVVIVAALDGTFQRQVSSSPPALELKFEICSAIWTYLKTSTKV